MNYIIVDPISNSRISFCHMMGFFLRAHAVFGEVASKWQQIC